MSNLLARPLRTSAGGGGGGGGGDVDVNVQVNINQAAHGFSVGNVLHYTGSGLALAQADAMGTADADGIVLSVTDVDNFVFCLFGQAVVGALTDDDSNSLTAGTNYYVSETTAGSFTPIRPVGISNFVKPIFKTTNVATTVIVNPQLGVQGAP